MYQGTLSREGFVFQVNFLSLHRHADLGMIAAVSRCFRSLSEENYRSLWGSRLVTVKCENDAPSGRTCHSAVQHGGRMFSIGGMPDSKTISSVKKELCILDLATWTWRIVLDCVPAVTEQTAVLYNSCIYLFGGYYEQEGRQSHLYRISGLDEDTPTLTTLCADDAGKPPPRSSHTAIVHNKSMYVFGGWDKVTPKNDLYELDLERNQWRCVHGDLTPQDDAMVPTPRRAHCAFLIADSMYIFGGTTRIKNDDVECPTDVMSALHIPSETWVAQDVLGDVPCPRSRCDGTVHGDLFFLAGGWDRSRHLSDFHYFCAATGMWRRLPVSMPFGIVQHSVVTWDEKMLMFGGYKHPLEQRAQCGEPTRGKKERGVRGTPLLGHTANDVHLYQLKVAAPTLAEKNRAQCASLSQAGGGNACSSVAAGVAVRRESGGPGWSECESDGLSDAQWSTCTPLSAPLSIE